MGKILINWVYFENTPNILHWDNVQLMVPTYYYNDRCKFGYVQKGNVWQPCHKESTIHKTEKYHQKWNMCDSCQHTVCPQQQCNTDAASKETVENLWKDGSTDSELCFGVGKYNIQTPWGRRNDEENDRCYIYVNMATNLWVS